MWEPPALGLPPPPSSKYIYRKGERSSLIKKEYVYGSTLASMIKL
jgi:hypothetical protein